VEMQMVLLHWNWWGWHVRGGHDRCSSSPSRQLRTPSHTRDMSMQGYRLRALFDWHVNVSGGQVRSPKSTNRATKHLFFENKNYKQINKWNVCEIWIPIGHIEWPQLSLFLEVFSSQCIKSPYNYQFGNSKGDPISHDVLISSSGVGIWLRGYRYESSAGTASRHLDVHPQHVIILEMDMCAI
jgi:hypothetical protein